MKKRTISQRHSTQVWLCTWMDHVVPALKYVQACMLTDNGDNSRFFAATFAAVTSISASLIVSIAAIPIESSSSNEEIENLSHTCWELGRLIESSATEHSGRGSFLSIICNHPWRLQRESRCVLTETSSFEALLAYFTCETILDDKVCEQRKNETCYTDTTWEATGVALLVSSAWDNRPFVWSTNYQWRCAFPHVAPLLNGENGSAAVQGIGCSFLLKLLSTAPVQEQHHHKEANFDRPANPTGTFQLLINRVVAASSGQPDQKLVAAQAYDLMKRLLSKYKPISQFRLVKSLLHSCPHFSMKPKIVDLWRGVISWKDQAAELKLFVSLRDPVNKLTRHVKNGNLLDVDELIDMSEFYSAVLGVLLLWTRVGSYPIPEKNSLTSQLKLFQSALIETSQSWGKGDILFPDQGHRLNILSDSTEQLLSVL